jgi:hypothetical protein
LERLAGSLPTWPALAALDSETDLIELKADPFDRATTMSPRL